MSSVYDEGYAEAQREACDLWFGAPGYDDPPDDDRDDDEAVEP